MEYYVGTIVRFFGSYTIYGFMPCDGRALNRSLYPTLFERIGTTYGDDGPDTFRVPALTSDAGSFQICAEGNLPPGV